MSKHSTFSPSRLSTILACPGYIPLKKQLNLPESTNPDAEHGTMLHDKVHKAILGNKQEFADLSINDKAYCTECLDYLNVLIKSLGGNVYSLKTEAKIDLKCYGLPEVYGTADIILHDLITNIIHVIDWKFGSGVLVYAPKNPQLMAYGAGAIPSLLLHENCKVVIHVVQPPRDNITTWETSGNELYEWAHGTVALAVNKAKSPNSIFVPGEKQCRWCENKNHCETRYAWVQKMAALIFDLKNRHMHTIPKKSIEELLEQVPFLEQAIKDYKNYRFSEMQKGEKYSGYKLVQGTTNRKWKDERETINWLSEHSAIEEMFVSKIISPAAAEKLEKGLKKSESFQNLYAKYPGKLTIAKENDLRPEVKPEHKVSDVFKNYIKPNEG